MKWQQNPQKKAYKKLSWTEKIEPTTFFLKQICVISAAAIFWRGINMKVQSPSVSTKLKRTPYIGYVVKEPIRKRVINREIIDI